MVNGWPSGPRWTTWVAVCKMPNKNMPAEPMNGNDTMMAPPADGANAPAMDTMKH